MRWHGVVAAALVIPLAIALAVAAGRPANGTPLPAAKRVIVVAAPGLSLRDGTLVRLHARGAAVGAMSVRAFHTRPSVAEGFLALGSGVRTRSVPAARDGAVVFAPADVRCPDCRAARPAQVTAIGELRDNNDRRLGSVPGALAGTLRAAGRDIVVLGDGPVALAGMDRGGAVRIGRGSLAALSRRHDVVIASAPDAAAANRMLPAAPPQGTLVMLVSVSPARGGHLTPAAIYGAGIPRGRLTSDSTRRDGIVTLSDVAPTILAALGVARPDGLDGRPLRTRPGATQLDRLLDLDARSARQIGSYRLVVYLTAATLLALIGLSLRGAHRAATATALLFASLPLATFLMRLLPNTPSNVATLGLTAAIAAAVAAAAGGLGRTPRGALTAVLIATAGVVGIDGATGGWLHTTTMLGYSLPGGGRFYGMPNSSFALLAAATVLAAGLAIERHGREALPAVAVAFVVVALLNCLPGLGSDVGGLLALTPVFGLTWLGLTGRRLHPRDALALAGAALVLLLVLGGADLLRADGDRTHLGRLFAEILHDGPRPLWDAIARKSSSNVYLLVHSAWTMALVVLVAVPWLLRARLSPTLRTTVSANLLLAAVGFALNDSGPVVIALALFYLGPLLAVLRAEERPSRADARDRRSSSSGATPEGLPTW